MRGGESLAQETSKAGDGGAIRPSASDRVEEPVAASPLLDTNGSKPASDDTGEGKHDNHSQYCCGSIKPMKCEAAETCDKSTPVVSTNIAEAVIADAQDQRSTAQGRENSPSKPSHCFPQAPLETVESKNGTVSPLGAAQQSHSERAVKETTAPPPSAHVSCSTRTLTVKPTDFIVLEECLMAPTPGHILKEVRDRKAETKEPGLEILSLLNLNPADQHFESPNQQQTLNAVNSDSSRGDMTVNSVSKALVGPPLCEGDTTLLHNFLPPAVIDGLFEQLCEEVHFKRMRHQGSEVPRFVAVQGAIDTDGTQPVYRHPSDESPPLAAFTPAVQLIRGHVERQLGHPVNHVLIQCYRNSSDYISEHSDKTLDIFRWSYIANVSIGATRTMVFRTKRGDKKAAGAAHTGNSSGSTTPLEAIDRAATKPVDILKEVQPVKRQTTRCPMPHNSLIKMGLVTNEKWLHGIKADKRPQSEKTTDELAWNGTRISLTFRYIVTFLSPSPHVSSSEPVIWGQGAVSKRREHARPVLNGQTPEAVAMLRSFGRENNSPDFDWEANYGGGFDVLHMKAAPRYFGCGDVVIDGRVRIMLAECGVKYARGDIGVDTKQQSLGRGVRGAAAGEVLPVRFVMDDADRTTVVGDVAILLFLDAKHPRKKGSDMEVAAVYSRFYAALALEQRWKSLWVYAPSSRQVFTRLKPQLMELEKWAAEVARCTGLESSIADYALWPVLHDIALAWKSLARGRGVGHTVFGYLGLAALDDYYREFGGRSSITGVFGTNVLASVLAEPGLANDDYSDEDGVVEVDDADTNPGKGKLPTFTEFGEVHL